MPPHDPNWHHNPYAEHGYRTRAQYLAGLAEEHDVPPAIVRNLAELLGPSEDFDGLVIALEDYTE